MAILVHDPSTSLNPHIWHPDQSVFERLVKSYLVLSQEKNKTPGSYQPTWLSYDCVILSCKIWKKMKKCFVSPPLKSTVMGGRGSGILSNAVIEQMPFHHMLKNYKNCTILTPWSSLWGVKVGMGRGGRWVLLGGQSRRFIQKNQAPRLNMTLSPYAEKLWKLH